MMNNKLNYIIDNELEKINTSYIDNELFSLIDVSNYNILELNRQKFVITQMEKLVNELFDNKHKYENINLKSDTLSKNNKVTTEKYINNISNDNKNLGDMIITKKSEDVKKITINQATFNYPIPILNVITKNNNDIIVLKFKKLNDYLSNTYFSSLSNVFYIMSNEQKTAELKDIKLNLINTFNKENYYKNYEYSTKYFKKIDADNIFSNNLSISLFMLKIYGDIIRTNIVYHKNNEYIYITKYNLDYATVLICEKDDYIYTLTKKDGTFIRGIDLSNIIGVDVIPDKKTLEKMKLDKLQNIAKMRNLNIKKQGKVGKINITKDELIQKITE